MNFGFDTLAFTVTSTDGRNFVLQIDARYTAKDGTVYLIPKGAASDGASTPSFLWPKIPPFGTYWRAAFLHDAAYRNALLVCHDGVTWVLADLPKTQCDDLLLEAMDACGTDWLMRDTIYRGVQLGGQAAFDADRAGKPAVEIKFVPQD